MLPLLRIIGNILWLILGGLALALAYALAGLIMFVLIITIPFGVQAFKLGGFTLWPFGRTLVRTTGPAGCLTIIGNVLWFFLAGLWLAIGHVVAAVALAITIIGIPFAYIHLKLALATLIPFGQTVVSTDDLQGRDATVSASYLGSENR